MTLILGTNRDVVIFGPLRVWAENGFVCIEDSRELRGKSGEFTQLHPYKALLHLAGLSQMLGNKTDSIAKYSDEWERQMRFVEQVQYVIRKAKEQGAYDDESANAEKIRRRSHSFLIQADTENWD